MTGANPTMTNTLNHWLSGLATAWKERGARGARRFASLVSASCELETAPAAVEDGSGSWRATLTVTSGLHRGAVLDLTAKEYVIGSADDCDIVLQDPALAPRHCRFAREWSGFVLRDLRAARSQPMAPQTVRYRGAMIEATYTIGAISFCLAQWPQDPGWHGEETGESKHPTAGAEDVRPWQRGLRSPRLAYGALGAAIVLVIVAAAVENRMAAQASPGASHAPPGQANGSPRTGIPNLREPASVLLDQVRHALAANELQVGLRDGKLQIAGTTRELAVKDRIRSLTADLKGVVVVDDRVAYVDAREHAEVGPLPVRLRGVMIGHPSYFVTDTGERYFVGGVLPDGAEVLAIEAGHIQFRVNGKVVVYNLE